ncbi:MAG: alanine--tRNA ligase-related protein [Patescibacteria group bacterium]|nr:alanine--tRNA ligase-related protein [Patescibacteria group bacterium]
MKSFEIRKLFLEYFQKNGHLLIQSASLVPNNDPTLLLINSGMAPLKPYFTGETIPPAQRLCNIQKCVRTNDIETVGDPHHLTFFEMMGNWSIGNYFKEEAICLAWHLIADVFGFDTNNIYATFYKGDALLPTVPADNESKIIWSQYIPNERIIPLGAESNFWGPAGTTGPCGPCTEVFFDRGKKFGCGKMSCGPDCNCGRFIEIWNPGVFMQYYMHENKTLTQLKMRSVDAGAGLDRFAFILQGKDSIYETDLLQSITDVITATNHLTSNDRSIRIITDHLRCSVFLITDGIYPSNTKREYVLRRLLRRTLLHSSIKMVTIDQLLTAVSTIVEIYKDFYPEMAIKEAAIKKVIENEMANFSKTLSRGLKEFEKIISSFPSGIPGEQAFYLHDTLGFNFELTKEIASHRGIPIDESDFRQRLQKQKEMSQRKP